MKGAGQSAISGYFDRAMFTTMVLHEVALALPVRWCEEPDWLALIVASAAAIVTSIFRPHQPKACPPLPAKRTSYALSPAAAARSIGRYQASPDLIMEVNAVNDAVFLRGWGGLSPARCTRRG
jgi:hypothetical protein